MSSLEDDTVMMAWRVCRMMTSKRRKIMLKNRCVFFFISAGGTNADFWLEQTLKIMVMMKVAAEMFLMNTS